MRLGVYVDTVYRAGGAEGSVLTNGQSFPFLHFVCEVGDRLDGLVLFGRRDPGDGGAEFELPSPARLVELPYYESLARGKQVLRAAPGTVRAMWRGLGHVDAVWVFGPYPFSPVLTLCALLRRKRVILGVRQDTMEYFRQRLPSRRAAPVLAPLKAVDLLYRLLSRWLPTVVVGDHLERQYGGPRPGLVALRISLVRAADVVAALQTRDMGTRVDLLTVGRIDPEKNPLLLVEALKLLEGQEPGRYGLRWVGRGPLREAVENHARELGVADLIEFVGYTPFGPELLDLYRSAHLFVHVAVTEAFGQVLTEAMACGTPIVATAVGGVPGAVEQGKAGLLVPPADANALALAIRRLADDPELRDALARRGLELARRHTLEAGAERVLSLL